MKKLFVLVSFIALSFVACKNETSNTNTESTGTSPAAGHELPDQKAVAYYCPMKCEGDKTYAEAGTCPKCGMDLVQVTENQDAHDGHDHEGHDH